MGYSDDDYQRLIQNVAQKGRHPVSAPPQGVNGTKPSKGAKYRNKPVLVDLGPSGEMVGGKLRLVHTFDSQREADYYAELVLRRKAGEIADLELQKSYALLAWVENSRSPAIIGYYEADFFFRDITADKTPTVSTNYGKWRVIDVKGMKTQVYALKKKLAEACWGITIEEV